MSMLNTVEVGETIRKATMVARADGSPIVTGTVNHYLKALDGANVGKWWKNSDQTWAVAETASAMAHEADGHWTITLAASPFTAGVRYLEYVKESTNLHIPTSMLLKGEYTPLADANRGVDLRTMNGTSIAGTSTYVATAFVTMFNVASPVFTAANVNQSGNAYPIVSDSVYGNAALDAEIDALGTVINSTVYGNAAIDTQVDAIAAVIGDSVFGNAAIETEMDSILGIVDDSIFGNAALDTEIDAIAAVLNDTVSGNAAIEAILSDSLSGNAAISDDIGDIYAIVNDSVFGNAAIDTTLGALVTTVGVAGAGLTAVEATVTGTVDANLIEINGTGIGGTADYIASAFITLFNVPSANFTLASVIQTGNSFAVVSHEDYGNNALLTAIGTRMATFTYTAPDNTGIANTYSIVNSATFGNSALNDKLSVLVPVANVATAYTLIQGTVISGSWNSTATADGTMFILAPAASALDVNLTFAAGSGWAPLTVSIIGRYQAAANHKVDVYAWNYDTAAWDQLTNTTTAMLHRTSNTTYVFPLARVYMDAAGAAKIRFASADVTTTYRLNIDRVFVNTVVTDAATSGVIVAGYAGGMDPETRVFNFADTQEGNLTLAQMLRVLLCAQVGKLSGAPGGPIIVRDTPDTMNRITATVDIVGNRTVVTLLPGT